MTVAFDPFADRTAASPSEPLLRDAAWDRLFVLGGAWLVPVPIVAFYLMRSLGLSVAAAEDIVTLLVMVPLGGPHVFATYTRTFLNPRFRKEDRVLFVLAFAVATIVIVAAVASAFFDVLLLGSPPIRYVLTFFFFWAGIHIVHQNSYVAACYAEKSRAGAPGRSQPRWWGALDYAVMLLALYPVSLFRMSMVNLADPTMQTADPQALATRVVVALSSSEFADEFVFRIGRVAPILPEFLRAPWLWMGVAVAFVVSVALFAHKSLRQHRQGTLLGLRFRLVLWTGVLGFLVPLFPNLDSAFQGMNAWHSFQYLGLVWLMNERSRQRGEIQNRLFDAISAPRRPTPFYLAGLGATFLLLLIVFAGGAVIEHCSGGEFALFGRTQPSLDPVTGRELYRPGAVLLAYYMIAFSVLLTHYLHDGVFFFRRRYLVDPAR